MSRVIRNNFFFSSVGSSYNSYVTNYLSRISALGYTAPNASRLSALNTLTNDLSSVLSKLDIFYVIALNDAGLSNAASLNIINPSLYQYSYVNSPTYGTTGVTGNGTTSYIDTNYNPATNGVNYLQNTASRSLYMYTSGANTHLEGNTVGTNAIIKASSIVQRINSGFTNLTGGAVDLTGTGYKGISRSTSSDVQLYNNATRSDRTATSAALTSANQLIHRNGSNYGDNTISFYSMGGLLVEAEHNLIRSSFITYLTAIGL